VRKGGTVTLIGNTGQDVAIPLQAWVTRQIRLQGLVRLGGRVPRMSLDLIARAR
jgi:L-iditol 2-dehydrogenase